MQHVRKTRVVRRLAYAAACAAACAFIIAIGAAGAAFGADATCFEGESMSENSTAIAAESDANASGRCPTGGNRALAYDQTGETASQSVTFSSVAEKVEIRVRGVDTNGTPTLPQVRVFMDGEDYALDKVLDEQVTSSYKTFTADLTRSADKAAGIHTIRVKMANGDSGDKIWVDWTAFTYALAADTTPPDTSVTAGPAEGSTDTDGNVAFEFASTEANSTFQCKTDSGDYASCSSPQDYTGLASGSHTFSVKATDPAGNTDSTPATRTFSVQAPSQPYPGLRFTKTVGVAVLASKNMTAQDVQDLYATYMKPAYHGADGSVDFVVQTKLNWPDVMDNPSVKPTLENMRNPNWSGYKWDTPGSDASEIDRMVQAPCVVNGKCKISINIGTGATGGTDPPAFMENNDLAWNGEGSGTDVRVKWYKSEARQYAEAFALATIKRFDGPAISGIKLNEYYPGSIKPADWNASGGQDAYEDGYYAFVQNVIAGAPRDAHGDRVPIYQTNPLDNADAFTNTQIVNLKLGIADSNAQLFESTRTGKYALLHGLVPLSAPLDAPPLKNNRTTTYDGTPNPWGYAKGTSHVITVPQIAWFHGHNGPVPMDQEFITKPGEPTDGFRAAMDALGTGGTWYGTATGKWGGTPYTQ